LKRGFGPSFFYLNVYECKPPTQTLEDDLHLLALCLSCSERDVRAAIPFAGRSASAAEDLGLYGDFSPRYGGGAAQAASALLGLDYQVDLSGQIGSVALPPTGRLRRKR
jgi:hypothetical protein